MGIFPKDRGENKKILGKPPPRNGFPKHKQLVIRLWGYVSFRGLSIAGIRVKILSQEAGISSQVC